MAFSEDWKEAILERIADGESLRSICRDEKLPGTSFVFKQLASDADFAQQYAHAREAQADAYFDETLEIADLADPESVQVARLRVDTRKWMAGKLRPKKYGDKLDVEHRGTIIVTATIGGDDGSR
jgi:hypothetical protein